METGIYATTHGVGYRDEENFFLKSGRAGTPSPI